MLAGMPQLLATSQNEGPFVLQDRRLVLLPVVLQFLLQHRTTRLESCLWKSQLNRLGLLVPCLSMNQHERQTKIQA